MRTLITLLLFGYLANAQDGYLVSYMQGNSNSLTTSDPTPSNTNPELDPVYSAHRFGDLEANAIEWESEVFTTLTGATIAPVSDTSNGYGSYVAELTATDATDAHATHRFDNGIVNGVTYHVFFIYRMTNGLKGRLTSSFTSSNVNYTWLEETDWTVIEFDATANTGDYISFNVFASYYGAVGGKIQYKIQVKEAL